MAAFRWNEAMSVGVPELDSDHRCLVRIINLLAEVEHGTDACSTVETVLDTIVPYAHFHFAREERVMETCGFPGAEFHRSRHAGLARFVHGLRARFVGRADREMAHELLYYLTGCLHHHILIQDMAYKPYVLSGNIRGANGAL